jgi:hypothetical protein
MVVERYPGECRVLRHFLVELQPVALTSLGRDSMLHHAIRRALAANSLNEMRRARRLFNVLPRALKKSLSDGLVERAVARQPPPPSTAGAEVRVLEVSSEGRIAVHLVPQARRPRPT